MVVGRLLYRRHFHCMAVEMVSNGLRAVIAQTQTAFDGQRTKQSCSKAGLQC